MKGQTVHLIRMTVLHILATLGPNDYINAIWFNSRRESLLRGCAEGFIPATTRNKKVKVYSVYVNFIFLNGIMFPFTNFPFILLFLYQMDFFLFFFKFYFLLI